MAKDYKLCPNCNNALDLNVSKCPYCGQQTYWLDLSRWRDVIKNNNVDKSKDKGKSIGCVWIIIFFIGIQIIGAIFSFIFQLVTSLF